MRVIVHKYPLQVGAKVSIALPQGAQLLRCQMQGGVPMLWVLKPVDNKVHPHQMRTFMVVGTGWAVDEPEDLVYVDTTQQGDLVWHAFELMQPPGPYQTN